MGAQDKTEQVLREIHIMLSQSEVYDKATNRVIIDKKEALMLLRQLNACIYEMMEQYEMTEQSRAAAERELRRKTEDAMRNARRMAEDVYAASVLYSDDALCRVQDIMQDVTESMKQIYEKMNQELQREMAEVRTNRTDLRGYLEDLHDMKKYEQLIDERNKEIAKQKAKDKEEIKAEQPSPYAGIKPEIKVNPEYFEKAGISLEPDMLEEILVETPEKKTETPAPEVKVNLDAEYFKWKEENGEPEADNKKAERTTLLGKILKGEK